MGGGEILKYMYIMVDRLTGGEEGRKVYEMSKMSNKRSGRTIDRILKEEIGFFVSIPTTEPGFFTFIPPSGDGGQVKELCSRAPREERSDHILWK